MKDKSNPVPPPPPSTTSLDRPSVTGLAAQKHYDFYKVIQDYLDRAATVIDLARESGFPLLAAMEPE